MLITGVTELNRYYADNYVKLINYCADKFITEDYLNDAYLKIRTLIIKSGITITNLTSYVKKTMWNLFLDDKKSPRCRLVEYETDKKKTEVIENKLNEIATNALLTEEEELIELERKETVKKIIKLIENSNEINPIDEVVFKFYYTSNLTYREIAFKLGLTPIRCRKSVMLCRNYIKKNFKIDE